MPWGMGRWGWIYPHPYAPYAEPYGGLWGYGPSPEQAKQMLLDWRRSLQDQKKYLDDQLQRIEERLSELNSSEDK